MCCCLTAKDKGEKKLFGYSFVPLMQEDGRTLPDGTHELIVHKVRSDFSQHTVHITHKMHWGGVDRKLPHLNEQFHLELTLILRD